MRHVLQQTDCDKMYCSHWKSTKGSYISSLSRSIKARAAMSALDMLNEKTRLWLAIKNFAWLGSRWQNKKNKSHGDEFMSRWISWKKIRSVPWGNFCGREESLWEHNLLIASKVFSRKTLQITRAEYCTCSKVLVSRLTEETFYATDCTQGFCGLQCRGERIIFFVTTACKFRSRRDLNMLVNLPFKAGTVLVLVR